MHRWTRRIGAGVAVALLALLFWTGPPLLAAVDRPAQSSQTGEPVGEPPPIEIDDGAVPLAELPPQRAIPLELMLATGGLVFGGFSIYALRSRSAAKRNKRR